MLRTFTTLFPYLRNSRVSRLKFRTKVTRDRPLGLDQGKCRSQSCRHFTSITGVRSPFYLTVLCSSTPPQFECRSTDRALSYPEKGEQWNDKRDGPKHVYSDPLRSPTNTFRVGSVSLDVLVSGSTKLGTSPMTRGIRVPRPTKPS